MLVFLDVIVLCFLWSYKCCVEGEIIYGYERRKAGEKST